jgi:hypothetical protein
MSQKKMKALRKAAKYKPKVEKEYGLFGFKRIDTGAGKSVKVGGSLQVKGPRSLYKQMKKEFYERKKAGKRS